MLKYLRQLASESLIYGLAGTLTRFITIFLVPFYTRVLSPTDYGRMSLIRNTITLCGMLSSLSLDSAAHRFYWDTEDVADRKSTIATWAWSWIVLSTLSASFIIIFADRLAMKIVGNPNAIQPLRLAALALPLGVLSVVYMNRLRMERRPWAFSIFALISSVTGIILTVWFVLIMRRGVEGIFLAQLLSSLAISIVLISFVWEWIQPRHFDWKRYGAMLRYAVPMLPGVASLWVMDVIDRYFLQVYATTAQIGVYEIGYSIAAAVALGTTAFQQAWLPFAMSIQNVPDVKEIYANTLIAYTWVGCFACVGASLFAPEALRLLTTEAYYGASTVVVYLAFSYFFMGAMYIVALGANIKKQTVSIGVAVVIGALINVGLNFWLVPRYGKDGAAVATLLAYMIMPIYMGYRSQQVYHIPFRFGRALAIVAFAVITIRIGGMFGLENFWGTLFAKVTLLSMFLPLLFALRIVQPAHVRSVIARWRTGEA